MARQSGQVVGVVPLPQILHDQDEVDRVVGHARGVHVRRRHGSAAGDLLIERQLPSVAAEHVHGSARLGLRGQFHDNGLRHAVTGEVQAIEQ
jgi:hypothetical protein